MSTQLPVIEVERQAHAKAQYVVVDPDYEKSQAEDEIDLKELLFVLRRRKGVILLATLLVFVLGFMITMNIQPTYRSTTTIQIESEDSAKVLSFDVGITGDSANSEFFQTQYELLQSRVLARKVIEELKIAKREPAPEDESFLTQTKQSLKRLVTWNDENKPIYKLGAYPPEKEFLQGLSISPVKKSQIVSISYESKDPGFATKAANSVAKNFIELTSERRKQSSFAAKKFIEDELEAAKKELIKLESELTGYARKAEIIQAGDANSQSLVSQTAIEVNSALAKARTTRIEAEALYRNLQNSKGTDSVLNSATIQHLKLSLEA